MINPNLKRLENQIIDWAITCSSIRAAIVCGSTERWINPGDEWADLDFEIYVTDFSDFIKGVEWLNRFGTLWTHLQLQEGDSPVFLALYNGSEKVDFHFFNITKLQNLVDNQELHDSYIRGYRIVIDKDNLAVKLPSSLSTPPPFAKPSADEFAFHINAFWYGALYIAKQIRRRNLWVVKFRDWTTKQSLLKILEWHAQTTHQWNYDTWHDGHFMSQWIDSSTWKALQFTFGEFECDSSWRALLATMDLFHQVAIETAQGLGYSYSLELDNKITEYVKSLYQADDLSKPHH